MSHSKIGGFVSHPYIAFRTDDSSPTQIPGPVLLDDATWTKIEELVKTENSSAQKERKRTWFYGFLAGLVVAATVNIMASFAESVKGEIY